MSIIDITSQATRFITLADISQEAGIALQSLKQYRQADGNAGQRNASPETQKAIYSAVAKLAAAQARHFEKLAQRAKKGP